MYEFEGKGLPHTVVAALRLSRLWRLQKDERCLHNIKPTAPRAKKCSSTTWPKSHAELTIHIMSPETVLSMRKPMRLCGCDCPLCSDAQQEGPAKKRFAYSHNNNNRKHHVLPKIHTQVLTANTFIAKSDL